MALNKANATRDYAYASGQHITTSGTSARSTQINQDEVMLHASAKCYVRVGDSTVVATVGAGSFPLEAGEKFHVTIPAGSYVAVIQDTAAGILTVLPVA